MGGDQLTAGAPTDAFPDDIWVGSVRYVRETKPENAEYPVVIAIDACFCGLFTASPHDRTASCQQAYTIGTVGGTTA
jgi:hypothetical protein